MFVIGEPVAPRSQVPLGPGAMVGIVVGEDVEELDPGVPGPSDGTGDLDRRCRVRTAGDGTQDGPSLVETGGASGHHHRAVHGSEDLLKRRSGHR